MYREKEESYSIVKSLAGLTSYQTTNEIVVDRPTIIHFGGNMTDNDQRALSMCRISKSWLGLHITDELSNFARDGQINMYSINYGIEDSEDFLSATHLTSEECLDLLKKIFYPLIFKEENILYDYNQILNNFSRLHFVTHCYGALALNEVCEYLGELLTHLNFNYEEISKLMGTIVSINYAPMRKPLMLTNINVMSLRDDIINHSKYKHLCTNPITINTDDNNLNIISKRIVTKDFARLYINDHEIKTLYRNSQWQLQFKATTDDMENVHVYSGKNAECISEIICHILAENIAISLRREYGENISKPTINDMESLASKILSYYSQDELIP